MTSATWNVSGNGNYGSASNWTPAAIPGMNDVASFGYSIQTNVSIDAAFDVGVWFFTAAAPDYTFTVSSTGSTAFDKAGITTGANTVTITNSGKLQFESGSAAGGAIIKNKLAGELDFLDTSSANDANITNDGNINFNGGSAENARVVNLGRVLFEGSSTAGTATIHNSGNLQFSTASSGGSATIYTVFGGTTVFQGHTDPDMAQFITDASSTVDFSHILGEFTVGSIAGAGTYILNAETFIGIDGLSTTVSGPVEGGGLVKVGAGKLKLSHAHNTYSATILQGGTLDLAAVGAAGNGPIYFGLDGQFFAAHLKIQNRALSHHVLANQIDGFGRNDVIDLTGLKFHVGATVTYHKANHHLTLHSGSVTDTLKLHSPTGTHFAVANDGHGGTKVTLVSAHVAATVALLSPHDFAVQHEATDIAGSASHPGDFLFMA
jgi:autotransporter-associated beta strand protein